MATCVPFRGHRTSIPQLHSHGLHCSFKWPSATICFSFLAIAQREDGRVFRNPENTKLAQYSDRTALLECQILHKTVQFPELPPSSCRQETRFSWVGGGSFYYHDECQRLLQAYERFRNRSLLRQMNLLWRLVFEFAWQTYENMWGENASVYVQEDPSHSAAVKHLEIQYGELSCP